MQFQNPFLVPCFVVLLKGCLAQEPQCTTVGTAFCDGASLQNNIILRCTQGSGSSPQSGNCNDNLSDAPPYGVKSGALCWESSPTAGDAQCTFDCVAVTTLNGTSFYPLGCSRGTSILSSAPSSTSLEYPSSSSTTQVLAITAPSPNPSTKSGMGASATVWIGHIVLALAVIVGAGYIAFQ